MWLRGCPEVFSEELKEKYIRRGCDPEILEAVEMLAEHYADIVSCSRLFRIRISVLERKRGISLMK